MISPLNSKRSLKGGQCFFRIKQLLLLWCFEGCIGNRHWVNCFSYTIGVGARDPCLYWMKLLEWWFPLYRQRCNIHCKSNAWLLYKIYSVRRVKVSNTPSVGEKCICKLFSLSLFSPFSTLRACWFKFLSWVFLPCHWLVLCRHGFWCLGSMPL